MNYDKNNPYLSGIKKRYSLTKEGSTKSTQHIVLDLSDSELSYSVGDTLGVYPIHDSGLVKKTLSSIGASGDEIIREKRTEKEWKFRDFLQCRANITDPSRKLLFEIASKQKNKKKKEHLDTLFLPERKEELKKHLSERVVWQVLQEHSEVKLTPQELCDLMMPLLPRFYSIASSPHIAKDEVHLTVAMVEYQQGGHERRGVCSHYLCNLIDTKDKTVPIYLQPHRGFTLPEDPNSSMIMVGPGTGIAPFRGFMQERVATNAPGKNWLFFGARSRKTDFFYEDEWNRYVEMGKLRLDTAFSRDQEQKVYVQHLMMEKGKELFSWLEERAYFYVCGDAKNMAKDVDSTLHAIVQQHGCMDEQQAKEYIKSLRKQQRYLRDVY